jgi:sulfide:quinone oxidoreductase
MDIRKITDELSVAPQIHAAEVPAIAAAGFRAVICNRPDGESSDQPCGSDIEAAVKANGLAWRCQPVPSGSVGLADAREFGALLAELPKPVLAYCRSGTRCATLWSLSEAGRRPLTDIVSRAASAGYDVALRHGLPRRAGCVAAQPVSRAAGVDRSAGLLYLRKGRLAPKDNFALRPVP